MLAQGASSNGIARLIPMFLMLCHGFPGFQKDPLLGVVDYFKNVPGHLSKTFRDINVLLPELPNVGAIPLAQRAPILSGEIAKHVPASERVHIIGHSAGGIDARLLASPAGLNQGHRIASITTVGSPHHGALIANILANPTAEFAFLLPGLQPFALGIRDFTTASMAQFNRDVIDHPQVAYQSFGGTTGLLTRGVIGVPFLLTHPIILHREGMNDGWVSVASSRHGVFRGAVSADHAELIGHELSPAGEFFAALGHPVFDHLTFYEQIVASLGAARR